MHTDVLKFLITYQVDVALVNKLLVSLFINSNALTIQHNRLLKQLEFSEDDPDKKVFKDFQALFQQYEQRFDFGDLIQLFEYTIPNHDRIINGIVYTPKYIKHFIIDEVCANLERSIFQSTFCDLACGCGGFLYTVAKKIHKETHKPYAEIFRDNLFGLDIKDYSIQRTKILLSLLAVSQGEDSEIFDFNLCAGNALDFDWFDHFSMIRKNTGFDAIFGNPPYVALRHIDDESRTLLARWEVTHGGNTDLYIPFFEIGLTYLKENGILGYITVNTFFRSLNGRALRKYLSDHAFDMKIVDFGNEQIFGNRSTYTCLCFIQKRIRKQIRFTQATSVQIQKKHILTFDELPYSALDPLRGWVLCPKEALEKIRAIESTGQPLEKQYTMRTGLATLANHVYIFKPVKEDEHYYYRKDNGGVFPVEKAICRDVINPNKIRCEVDIREHLEKIIFPYHKKENTLDIFNEDYFKTTFPSAYEYLRRHKSILAQRDKGKGQYYQWFAFGRTQSLLESGYKLLFPHITTHPRFTFTDQRELLFYNGHAIYSESKQELLILKIILESEIFQFYISYSSKPYTNGYFSLSKNYIKHFGICELSLEEKEFLLNNHDVPQINRLLQKKYRVTLDVSEKL